MTRCMITLNHARITDLMMLVIVQCNHQTPQLSAFSHKSCHSHQSSIHSVDWSILGHHVTVNKSMFINDTDKCREILRMETGKQEILEKFHRCWRSILGWWCAYQDKCPDDGADTVPGHHLSSAQVLRQWSSGARAETCDPGFSSVVWSVSVHSLRPQHGPEHKYWSGQQ